MGEAVVRIEPAPLPSRKLLLYSKYTLYHMQVRVILSQSHKLYKYVISNSPTEVSKGSDTCGAARTR